MCVIELCPSGGGGYFKAVFNVEMVNLMVNHQLGNNQLLMGNHQL